MPKKTQLRLFDDKSVTKKSVKLKPASELMKAVARKDVIQNVLMPKKANPNIYRKFLELDRQIIIMVI